MALTVFVTGPFVLEYDNLLTFQSHSGWSPQIRGIPLAWELSRP